MFLKIFFDFFLLSQIRNNTIALHCSCRTMEEWGKTKEKKLTLQWWQCWCLAVASLSRLPMVLDDGSPFFFVSAWLPLSLYVFASFVSTDGGANQWRCCWCFFFQTRWLYNGELLRRSTQGRSQNYLLGGAIINIIKYNIYFTLLYMSCKKTCIIQFYSNNLL